MGNKASSHDPVDEASLAAAAAASKEEIVSDETLRHLSFTSTPNARLPLVYSERYNIGFWGIEKLHPFDSKKYEKVVAGLVDEYHIANRSDFFAPIEAPGSVLRLVHTKEYLESLHSSMNVARILEVPPVAALPNALVQSKALTPMRYATAGTILGAQLAMRGAGDKREETNENEQEERKESSSSSTSSSPHVAPGWSINLSGGFHHCSASSGGGFCPFSDISLAIVTLAKTKGVKKAMIVDLDAHQGNGHARDKLNGVFARNGVEVFILDMFNAGIYPHDRHAQTGIDCPVRLKSGTGDEQYLGLLRKHLSESLAKFRPEFVLYNAGTDCLTGDPLGLLDLSPQGIIDRDSIVFQQCRETKVPVCMVLSGGYQKSNAGVIAKSIANLRESMQLWQVEEKEGGKKDGGSSTKKNKKKEQENIKSEL